MVIGAFVVHFLAIHPFQDGNGRLSRVLTTLMLLQNGYNYVQYCSLESIVEQNKDHYHQALRKTQ